MFIEQNSNTNFKHFQIKILFNINMFQGNKLNLLLLISLSVFFGASAQLNNCWDPSTGSQVNCVSPDNVFCVTNFTSGVGSCSATQPTDPSFLYCSSGDGCNKIVTKCYNPASRVSSRKSKHSNSNSIEDTQDNNLSGYVSCDATGLDQYCQVSHKKLENTFIEIIYFKFN